MFNNVNEIIQANADGGGLYFSKDTMRFFKTRVLDGVHGGRYFVTSEKGPSGVRAYTVRKADDDGTISTVGEFQAYSTASEARTAARQESLTVEVN